MATLTLDEVEYETDNFNDLQEPNRWGDSVQQQSCRHSWTINCRACDLWVSHL